MFSVYGSKAKDSSMPVTTRSQANTDANQGNGRPRGKMFVSSIQIKVLSHKARTRSSKTKPDLLSTRTRQKRSTLSSASRRSQTKYVSSDVPCPNDDRLSTNDSIPTNSYNTPTSTHAGLESPPTIRRTCSRTSRPTWAG